MTFTSLVVDSLPCITLVPRAKKYGPVVRVNVFHKTSVIVTSPESVKVGDRVVSEGSPPPPWDGCMKVYPQGLWEKRSRVTRIWAGFPRILKGTASFPLTTHFLAVGLGAS